MKSFLRLAALAASVAIPLPLTTASAQRPQTRKGFTAALGLGSGSVGISCTQCPSDRETSLGVLVRFGGAIRSNVVLAGEVEGWSKEVDGGEFQLTWGSFAALWYPNDARGFFVKGGIAVSGITAEAREGFLSAKIETAGLGLVTGAGYDIRVARNFSLTPYANFLFASEADAKVNGTSTGFKIGGNMVHIGIAATWH